MKIKSKIVGFAVSKPETDGVDNAPQEEKTADVIQMHETLQRPEKLIGSTYKLKVPEHVSPNAIYITINDIILNEGTEHEHRRPFEVFINSKNLEHYQWIVALTLIISACFRKGGDITFLVDELRSVFDPRGGFWDKGKYTPSIVAALGDIIEQHLMEIGMIKRPELDAHQKALLDKKATEINQESNSTASAEKADDSVSSEASWQANASLCNKCNNKSVVVRDGCQTCMNCGDSKCG